MFIIVQCYRSVYYCCCCCRYYCCYLFLLLSLIIIIIIIIITRSAATGFGRHSMPPPASNDTGTALGQGCSDWSRDLVTVTFDPRGHGTCGWCGSSSSTHMPSLKYVGLAVRKLWRTMSVSINGPGDLDLWPFDLETGMRVTSKVGNLPSKFGHTRLLRSSFTRYVGDRPTDKSNAYCPFPYLREDNNIY